MSEQLKFGYNKGLPPDVTTAWGCRAVVHPDGFGLDVPPDRESGFGDWHTLIGYLRDHDGEGWISKATMMFASGELSVRSGTEVVLFENDRAVIKANPQRSHGYLYVCAYWKPEPAGSDGPPALRELLRLDG
ncbi:hypothetical protein [Amycolatopsis taiwanensis]|uniref:hypothetical protein n=1 Tax=Amycolatopsis taiwanensis TaxID=342230 RepID=UPI000489878A|nr:hypothetical protein [Amycolatopsis taiwanensis]